MLSEIEKEIITKTMSRNKIVPTSNINIDDIETRYLRQGNFAICVLLYEGKLLSVGVAKRNPTDDFIPAIGFKRSFNVAVKNI